MHHKYKSAMEHYKSVLRKKYDKIKNNNYK